MNSLSTRIKERMKSLEMTQEMLARKMGITRGAITHYLAGRRVPPLGQFKKLAAILKTDPAWLQYGAVIEKSTFAETPGTVQYSLPILSWEQTAELNDIDKIDRKTAECIPNFFTNQPRWYALRIKGDAMTAPLGNSKSFIEGDFIIIDPDKTAAHGSYVIALLPRAKEVTFKQLVIDGGIPYLKPLNPQYPIMQIDEGTHVCGILAGSIVTM